MKREGILTVAILLFLVVSFARNARVETKDVQPIQRFEQVISGHVTDLNGKYKFRVSELTYQPGGYVGDHNHAGPGVRVIMAGEFTYVKGDKTTVYKAGDAFFEPGDVTHRAYNRGNTILKVMNRNPARGLQWICAHTAAALNRAVERYRPTSESNEDGCWSGASCEVGGEQCPALCNEQLCV